MVKTVRFTKVVEETGTPEPYTLWLPPEKDRDFQAAIKAHRVMTVHQANTGAATDFGEIGFVKDVHGSFLLFPKSLQRYDGCRVVGVKYELLKETPAEAPAPKPKKRASKAGTAAPKAKRQPRSPKPKHAEAPPKPAKVAPAPAPKYEPLRVFEPEEAKKQPKTTKQPAPPKARGESQQWNELTREVRKAMKKLEQGNAVAAYRILEKCVPSK